MNTYGIGYDIEQRPKPYYIVEQGVRLPMQFASTDGAHQQIRFMKVGTPLTRDEILDVVAEYMVKRGSK